MSSTALALFRPQGGRSLQVSDLGLSAVYGGVSQPSFAFLAQQLLFRLLWNILERIYRYVESTFVTKFDAYMSRLSAPKDAPESKILKEIYEQQSAVKQAPLSAAMASDFERLSMKGHSPLEPPTQPRPSPKPMYGPPAFQQSWWDLPAAGPPSWIVKTWEKRGMPEMFKKFQRQPSTD